MITPNIIDAIAGPAGTAWRLGFDDLKAAVAVWWIWAPGQSPFWSAYLLHVVHLRPGPGLPEPFIVVPGATHELMVAVLDPQQHKSPGDPIEQWHHLTPFNVVEQFQVPDDNHAAELAGLAATAIVNGVLPAEPMLAGAREPWRTAIIKTSAHLRGEEHAA